MLDTLDLYIFFLLVLKGYCLLKMKRKTKKILFCFFVSLREGKGLEWQALTRIFVCPGFVILNLPL